MTKQNNGASVKERPLGDTAWLWFVLGSIFGTTVTTILFIGAS